MLDEILLSPTGSADYGWDAAGNLNTLVRGANHLDFTFDEASRMSLVERGDGMTVADSSSFLYDGRGYLRQATEPASGATVAPLYDSAGLLQALVEKDSPASPERRHTLFYLAGRPVAQLTQQDGTETWQYLTTDHLGTPLLAADDTGTITWSGGFEPFGADYAAGTAGSALAAEVFGRFPGQWETKLWANAVLGTGGVYYNVFRWYELQAARYLRPDPLGLLPPERRAENLWMYGGANPLLYIDLLGLDAYTQDPGVRDCLYCLFYRGGYGIRNSEEGLWLVCDGEEYTCNFWPRTIRQGTTTRSSTAANPRPPGACAIFHTHPRQKGPRPSACDQPDCDVMVSKRTRLPIYVVYPSGVWKYDPKTDNITQEEDSSWVDGPKSRCNKKPCEGF